MANKKIIRNPGPALPTLMIRGNLQVPGGAPAELKEELDAWIPYEYITDWLRVRMAKTGIVNRVLILKSETGSGKSTLLPPELFKAFVYKKQNARSIICTQPRVITAVRNVSEMLDNYTKELKRGINIGWMTQSNKMEMKNAGIMSATIGTLTQQIKHWTDNEIMRKYAIIMLDETHERDLQTDATIYMLKYFLQRNQNNPMCPFVILMSATFDPGRFAKYFGIKVVDNFIWCTGAPAGFVEKWEWNKDRTVNNFTKAAADVVEIILENGGEEDAMTAADILIFMPGKGQINDTADFLQQINAKRAKVGKKLLSVIQIDSEAVTAQNLDFEKLISIPLEAQKEEVNGKRYKVGRRVIISTNVAETGLTLPNLKYVIDAGFNREIEFNPILGVRSLLTKPAPVSRVIQRRGRAGRKFTGVFYPLYPLYIFEKLPKQQFPQILTEDISSILLTMVVEQLKWKLYLGEDAEFRMEDVDMIDNPSSDSIGMAIEKAYSLGLLSFRAPKWERTVEDTLAGACGDRFSISKLGLICGALSFMSMEFARMVMSGYYWEAAPLDLLSVVAYVSGSSKDYTVMDKSGKGKLQIDWAAIYEDGLPGYMNPISVGKVRVLIGDEFLDGIILVNAVKRVIARAKMGCSFAEVREWCEKAKISHRAILGLVQRREDIINQMLGQRFDVFRNEANSLGLAKREDFMSTVTKLKHCIYDGFRNNLLVNRDNKYYMLCGQLVGVTSIYAGLGGLKPFPKCVLYYELELKNDIKTSLYSVRACRVSILDGFVSPDLNFLI